MLDLRVRDAAHRSCHDEVMNARTALAACALVAGLGCSPVTPPAAELLAGAPLANWSAYAKDAADTLLRRFYLSTGQWKACLAPGCGASNRDWGSDSLTFVLYLRWLETHDETLKSVFAALTESMPDYAQCEGCSWSDVPSWDAVAALREYAVTASPTALSRAKGALTYVDRTHVFASGACPDVHYQLPDKGSGGLKTLETDSNYVKASLLVYGVTNESMYLDAALRTYAAIRSQFLDPSAPLYTAYVLDDGHACTQIPRRFFASVNGNMISNGLLLARATDRAAYRSDALATGEAVATYLGDARQVFANLQAENDVAEPLVEAMLDLADGEGQAFARDWIARAASAAVGARRPDGTYGRFFDGPSPQSPATAWQTNGGLALAVAAASLASAAPPGSVSDWSTAKLFVDDQSKLPIGVSFEGSGIAIVGTLGEDCCENGHATLLVDGIETYDRTGVWQNKSSAGFPIDDTVLFAWRWPASGPHSIRFEAGDSNPKEGHPFAHIRGYYVLP